MDFETIADHLAVHVAVKDADLRYQYINLPGQLDRLSSEPASEHATALPQVLGAALSEHLMQSDRKALASPTPLVQWSEPRLRADGQSERIPQIKVGLRTEQGSPLGVMDVAPMSDLNSSDTTNEVMRMNQAIDLITDVLGLMMRCEDETALLERVCSTLVVRGGYLGAAIVPIEGDKRQVGVPLSLAGDRAELTLPGPFLLDDPAWEHHPVARAVERGLCVIHACEGPAPWPAAFTPRSAQALLALPLQSQDDVFAVLLMACEGHDTFTPSRVMLLQRMADELSLGLELLRSRARLAQERRQRDIHLRQQLLTSQRLSLATETADIGIWEWDLARGTVNLDERVSAQLGLPVHMRTLPIATVQGWIHPSDRQANDTATDTVAQQGLPCDITLRITPPDGRERVLRLSMSALRDEHSNQITGVMGATQDMTDHARHAQQLRELDAKLRLATEATGVGLWELDIATDTVLLDKRTRQIYGLPDEAGPLAQSAWLSWVHPGQRQALSKRLQGSLRHPTVGQLECAITPPDGRLRRVLVSWASTRNDEGVIAQLVGTQVDVTERRRDEARVEQTQHRLALMAGATGVGHWRYHLQDGFSFDEAMVRLLGATGNPPPAAAWLMEMCLPAAQREALELALITADDHLEVSLQWQGLDGLSRHVIWMGTVDRDARRTVIRGEGLCIDVTVQQQLHEARQAPRSQDHAVADRTALAARVSKELRSPLNAILGFVQLLRQQPPGQNNGEQDGYLGEVEKAGWHLLDVINQAMDLSRIESGHTPVTLSAVSLIDLIGELLPLAEQQGSPRQVRIDVGALQTWPRVRADRALLRQALLYLVGHAVQHSPRYGQVTLAFEHAGSHVQLTVSDQGPSLSDAQLARLFEAYIPPSAGATAEGASAPDMRLAMAHQSIEAMGGQLQASRQADGGTTVRLTLPASAPLDAPEDPHIEVSRSAPPIEQLQPNDAASGRLLYVEDNP
ncbi:MAG TPA: ATP-binding protein, partial [Aquabacterium sp.]|nr:ATP-binding protein [Aquabacterium sp.]